MAPDSGNHDDKAPTDGRSEISYIEERNALLQDIPYAIVRQAWFTLSHILLNTGARVAHLGCGDGQLTYVMAVLNPSITFIGVNKSRKAIHAAIEKYQLSNLEFEIGDISGEMFEEKSLDAIVNSFTLHQVYSDSRYNLRIVSDTLRKQFAMLKDDGIMFIQDYTKPSESEFVLMEMHDNESAGEELSKLSEADLLVWYSEHAQPKQDPGCGGFFLEELPPRFPRTRLFRLPYKWAYEFIMRKDNRDIWEKQLPFEFTYFTVDDFKKELHSLGAQMLYSAPHWEEDYIRKNFEGHFRLMQMNGETLGDPPTSFISVSRKRSERSSLSVKERRLTQKEVGTLKIKTLRNEVDGKIVDVVTRGKEVAEILPYRVDDKGRLFVYLHDGIIRGIGNTVHRNGENIDGRQWSGHMVEAPSVNYISVQKLGKITATKTKAFVETYTGLAVEEDALLTAGTIYYPDPNYIEERAHTYYAKIKENDKLLEPKAELVKGYSFREKGVLREFNAQNILDAIAVGLVPNSRLELQILSLMQHADVKSENWVRKDIQIATSRIIEEFNIKDFFKLLNKTDLRYKEVKGSAGQLKTVNSIFVEEGQSQGGRAGITAQPMDFVLSDDKTVNTAVVLPLSKSTKGDINAGFIVEHMPVPQRFEGNGLSLNVPQYNIPKEIKNYRQLKQFVAEKMGVKPNMVIKLGESYYTHIGITPQRIHPFAVFAPPGGFKGISCMPINRILWHAKSVSKPQHFMTTLARAYRFLADHIQLQAKRDVKLIISDVTKNTEPEWSLPFSVPQTAGEMSQGAAGQQQDSSNRQKAQAELKPDESFGQSASKDQDKGQDNEQDQDKDKDDGSGQGAQTGINVNKKSFLEISKKKKKAKKKKKKLGIAAKEAKFEASTDSDDFEDEAEENKKRIEGADLDSPDPSHEDTPHISDDSGDSSGSSDDGLEDDESYDFDEDPDNAPDLEDDLDLDEPKPE